MNRFRTLMTGLAVATMAPIVLCGSAMAAPKHPPYEVGKTYADAQSALSSTGFLVVVSTTVGGRLSQGACIVVNQHFIPARIASHEPGEFRPMQGFGHDRVMLSLNCNPAEAASQ